MYLHTYAQAYTFIHVYLYTYTHSAHAHTYIICTHMHTFVCMHIYMQTFIKNYLATGPRYLNTETFHLY